MDCTIAFICQSAGLIKAKWKRISLYMREDECAGSQKGRGGEGNAASM